MRFKSVKNIVVQLPKFIGDSVMATPAISLLRSLYPEAKITVLCRTPALAEVFERDPMLSTLVDSRHKGKYRQIPSFIRALKNNEFDLAVLFRNTFVDALCFRLAGIPNIIGYNTENRGPLLSYSEPKDDVRHYINQFVHIVNAAHNNPLTSHGPTELISNDSSPFIKKEHKGPKIACYFGSVKKGTRFYPTALAQQALESLSKGLPGHIYLIGDHEEQEENERLQLRLASQGIQVDNLSGKTSLTELIDVIANVDCLVTIDSSPLHIAAATGTHFVTVVTKGSSPWSRVEPKVDFGVSLLPQGRYISDDDQALGIAPERVANAVLNLLVKEDRQKYLHQVVSDLKQS